MDMFRTCTLIIIFYQCVFIMIISWWTLGCKFVPTHSELQEVSLLKLLYLYDPQACSFVRFYNVTVSTNNRILSTIMWPEKNNIAASFRSKLKISLSLHVVWFTLGVANVMYGTRNCGFFVALVPFTAAGVALLLMDCLFTVSFLRDINYTRNELGIISYILLHDSNRLAPLPLLQGELDTTWLALLLGYLSCRGVVQWLVNFWLVEDNFLRGLAVYRNHFICCKRYPAKRRVGEKTKGAKCLMLFHNAADVILISL